MATRRPPDFRWRKLVKCVKSKSPPTDALLRPIYDVIFGTKEDEVIDEVLSLVNHNFNHDIMVAFFLSGALFHEIENSIQVKRSVAKLVKLLIIDMQVFRNKLELLDYIRYYQRHLACKRGKKYVEIAVEGGPSDLAYVLRIGRESIEDFDPSNILKRLIMSTAHTSYALKNNPSVAAQKMLLEQTNAACKLLTAYDRMHEDDAPQSFEALAAIVNRRTAVPIDSLGITRDQLVH